ncbi:phage terminase small subunit [Cohnella xylanilytica]|uniref:phage terminase small subunit n=1 Tax=Cohnella xylanilytica TaxID=557555 RepID=UPI0028933AA8|nr:phage terminase small subunit [Cohnella xylanilytica]
MGWYVVVRPRSTNRTEALKIWIKSGRTKPLNEIALELGVSDSLIRKWKFLDKWDEIPTKRPRGAPKGNKNAVGNKGGGAPAGNQNHLKHGLYSKFLPQNEEFQDLMAMIQSLDPLDMLWQSVEIAFGKLLWAQRIMFIRDKEDQTKVLKKQKEGETSFEQEWEYQHAWDKQFTDIKAYATISREFRAAVKQFLSAAPENDERRVKLELMQQQVEKTKAEVKKVEAEAKKAGKSDEKTPLRIEVDYGEDSDYEMGGDVE